MKSEISQGVCIINDRREGRNRICLLQYAECLVDCCIASNDLKPADPHDSGTACAISKELRPKHFHSLSIVPLSISSLISLGDLPSTWHPTLKAVPSTSFTVPWRSLAKDLKRMVRAILTISSKGIDLVCLMFFSFFRSRGGSLSALITKEEAEGTTETAACRFWMVSFTVTRRPF